MNNKSYGFSNKIYTKKSIEKMQKKIDLLGYKKTYPATVFLNIRLITSVFIFFMILYLSKWGYILAPIITFLWYILLPVVYVDEKIEKRKQTLDDDALYFFEVLTLAIESGHNLQTAIEITSSNIDSELSFEFRKSLQDVKYGKSLNDALEDLKKRIPSDTINNIILNISQSNIFGNSIIETMYNQIDYISEKKVLDAKARISKIPIKISVISVIFFIPLLMLLVLGPVILNYIG